MSDSRNDMQSAHEREVALMESMADCVIEKAQLTRHEDQECVEITLADRRINPYRRTIRIAASEWLRVEEVQMPTISVREGGSAGISISEVIKKLEQIKAEHGDLPVVWDSLTHTFPVDPTVRERGRKVVVMND